MTNFNNIINFQICISLTNNNYEIIGIFENIPFKQFKIDKKN